MLALAQSSQSWFHLATKIRFGVILLPYSTSFDRLKETALRAERSGFDSVWISDHIQRSTTPTLECWTSIAAIASATSKIRIGSLATCNSFRNPLLLAKIVTTVSQISNGRVDLGIGAGYDYEEHLAGGFSFPAHQERTAKLSETIEVLKLLWKEDAVDYAGEHYQLKSARCLPKPEGSIRIWVAGRNEKLIDTASIRGAYGMNILPYSGVLEKRKLSSREELRSISEKIRAKSLALSMYCGDGGAIIGRDQEDYEKRVERAAEQMKISVQELKTRQENLSIVRGAIPQCSKSIGEISSLGFEELMLIFPGWQQGDYTNMDLFAENFLQRTG